MHIVYMNSHKEIGVYSLAKAYRENQDYITSYVSQKSRVITFRKDRIIDSFDDIQRALDFSHNLPPEIFELYDQKINYQKRQPPKIPIEYPLTFCFSGFSQAQKETIEQLTKNNGFRSVTAISSKVDYLVLCEKSETIGPTKINKAQSLGVKIIYEDQFFHLMETGEIPQGIEYQDTIFKGKLISFDGTFSRDIEQVKAKLGSLGAYISSKVTEKTDFLVIGENANKKVSKAQEYNVQVIYEDSFFILLDTICLEQ